MEELWQLFSEQALAFGDGETKQNILTKGLLHGAAHVWIVRQRDGIVEVLVQKRSMHGNRWPGMYDISAAGHINAGETPLEAGIRETKEELGFSVTSSQLKLINVYYTKLTANNGAIENEFQWIYLVELTDSNDFSLQESEVTSVDWKPVTVFKKECLTEQYVPHGKIYFDIVLEAIERLS